MAHSKISSVDFYLLLTAAKTLWKGALDTKVKL